MTGYYSSTKYSTIHVHAYTTWSHTYTHAQTVIVPFIFLPFVIFCSYIDVIFLSISDCSMNLSTSSSVTGFSSHCTSLKDNTTSNTHISLHQLHLQGFCSDGHLDGQIACGCEFLQANWMVFNLPPFCCHSAASKTRQVSPSCACWLRALACLWWWRHCRPWHQVSGCRWWPWAWSLRPSASGLKLVPCRMWTPRWWLGFVDPLRLFHEGVLWKSIRLSIGDCWNGWLVD